MVHVRTIENAAELVVSPPGAAARTPEFGHSGLLWHNSYLLYDRATESLWHHLTGRAMSGPLRGARLRRLPVSFLTFGAWRTEHPRTLVLPRPAVDPDVVGAPGGVATGTDTYESRNANLRFGYGVDGAPGNTGGASVLVPLDVLHGGPFETDLGSGPDAVPIVVVATDRRAAAAYDRRVGGRTLSFEVDIADGGRPLLREAGGRAAWSARSGAPVPGSGAQAPLRVLMGSVWETSAWRLQHPGGSVRTRERPR